MDYPEDEQWHVSHETIYQFIYAYPAGELCRALIAALRQGHTKRKPRTRGKDRHGHCGTCVLSGSVRRRPRTERYRATGKETSSKALTTAAPAPWWNAAAVLCFWPGWKASMPMRHWMGSAGAAQLAQICLADPLTCDQDKEMARHEEPERKVGSAFTLLTHTAPGSADQ